MKTQRPNIFFFLFVLQLPRTLLTMAQVVYVYAVFGRNGIQDVVLVKEVER
jgi:hypothetical protein